MLISHILQERGRFIPWDIEVAQYNFGANCGPVSFAVASGRQVCRVMQHFQHFEAKPWTNLTQMRQAFEETGVTPITHKREWPRFGVALIQWLGPWTQHDFFARWSLHHTHWVAVDRDWVFDHTEVRWMPRTEWAETVAPLFLEEIPHATGWAVKYGLESKSSIWAVSDSAASSCFDGSLSFSG